MRKIMAVIGAVLLLSAVGEAKAGSVAVEADALAYALKGHSFILRKTFDSGFDVALGTGKFTLPDFFIDMTQDNHDEMKWKARNDSIHVLRAGYRFSKPNEDGFSAHLIAMKQKWSITSDALHENSDFTVMSYGASVGYTYHIGKHFYLYPTIAYVGNSVTNGSNKIQGEKFNVPDSDFAESLHVGYEF